MSCTDKELARDRQETGQWSGTGNSMARDRYKDQPETGRTHAIYIQTINRSETATGKRQPMARQKAVQRQARE